MVSCIHSKKRRGDAIHLQIRSYSKQNVRNMFCVEVRGSFLVQKEMSKSHLMTARENTWNDERRLFSLLHTGYIYFKERVLFHICKQMTAFHFLSALTIRVLKFRNHSIIHWISKFSVLFIELSFWYTKNYLYDILIFQDKLNCRKFKI